MMWCVAPLKADDSARPIFIWSGVWEPGLFWRYQMGVLLTREPYFQSTTALMARGIPPAGGDSNLGAPRRSSRIRSTLSATRCVAEPFAPPPPIHGTAKFGIHDDVGVKLVGVVDDHAHGIDEVFVTEVDERLPDWIVPLR